MSRRHVLRQGSVASLVGRLEELVLANSGEDDFEEIFKLLMAKLWDERSGERAFHRGADARTLAAILARACAAWPGLFDEPRFRLAPDHLRACADVLADARLDGDGAALDAAFEILIARASKGRKGQFFTPRHVVDACVRMVAPCAGEAVLDPACGSGAFLVHALARAPVEPFGFDFDPRAVRIAKALFVLAGADAARARLGNSLKRGAIEDVRARFDVILTNPPFAGELRERALLDDYRLGRGHARVERDVLFVERCVELLRPGGRLAIVLPHGKLASSAYAPLRRLIVDELRVVAVVGLGRNTFQPHTSQKASVLVGVRRDRPGRAPGERVLFAVSERDGKAASGEPIVRADASGPAWARVDCDLDEIAARVARALEVA